MSAHCEALATGLHYHQAGQLDQAQQIYRQVVAAQPDNADAWSLLGAVCINLNRLDEAAEHLAEALRLNPDHFAAHDNLGVLLARQKRYAEAIASFRRALLVNPRQPVTQLNLANALVRNGQVGEAIGAFKMVVALAPDSLPAHTELAQIFTRENRLEEAAEHLAAVARLKRHDPRAHFERAAVLARIGRLDEAMAAYRETLRLKPDSAEACVNLANLHSERKELDEAVALLRRALEFRPRFAEAYLNLGCALTRQEKLVEAKAALSEAIRLKPEVSEVHNNLGIVLAEEGKFADAVECYRQALALKRDNVDALYNLGIALLKQQMIASALDCFEQAIELRPDFPEAHHNRAAAMLLSENFAEGFAEYQWRFRSRDYPAFRPRWPLWDGGPLAGRTIVLVAEQGLGDTIQFVRYAAIVKRQAARVVVECPRALHAMLARTPGVDAWIAPDDPAPAADCSVPLLSLPYRLKTTHATIPADVPYVFADPARVPAWRERLAEYPGFKIGIAWQGNPKCPGDRWRSIPLARHVPLAALGGVRLVSLQKGPGTDQLADLGEAWRIVDFGQSLDADGAFVDTAAIMQGLDLVVTSDTAIAHLAGALGVPTWVALSLVPDWRWMLERPDSPWYPGMRLFRQKQWADWTGVFEHMAAEVETLLAAGERSPAR
jgi:tetratricopeptide (TPR) repeat protein